MLKNASVNSIKNSNYTIPDQVKEIYDRKGLFAKMLVEPSRFKVKNIGLEYGYPRFKTEVSELKERHCIAVSSVSYLNPKIRFPLFRDIGFLIDVKGENVKEIFSTDVVTTLVDANNETCKWDRNTKSFINLNGKTTTFNGNF